MLSLMVLSALICLCSMVSAIGISVPPIAVGDRSRYSSLKNTLNCVSYRTSKDDIIMLNVFSGNRIASQKLNLHVFDSENNMLRTMDDLANDQTFMFTNLNNPLRYDASSNNFVGGSKKKARSEYSDLMVPNSGKSYIYICFDNVYYDKSWTFQKQPRDLTMSISIRNITTLKETNYNNYAKYFSQMADISKITPDVNNEFNLDFTEEDFETNIRRLETSLNEVSEELRSFEQILDVLKVHERDLRNANELIYETYTKTWIMVVFAICIFGLLQILYYKIYFKSHKLI